MSDPLTKVQAKLKRERDNEHRSKWQQVRKKIRRLKLSRSDKKVLIADSKHCNGDLMEVLYQAEQFTSVDDYFNTITAYLRSEMDCYDYKGIVLAYMPSNMEELMKIITNQHNILDRIDSLMEKLKE